MKNKAVKYSQFLAFLGSNEVGSIVGAEFILDPCTLFLEAFLYLPNCLAIRANNGNPVSRFSHRKKAHARYVSVLLIIDLPLREQFLMLP